MSGWDYWTRWITGDESGTVRYGYRVYGNGHYMEWQSGLPTAGEGSESIDLGGWLDFVGGLRDAPGPIDLMQEFVTNQKLKDMLEKVDKASEAIESAVESVEATIKLIEANRNNPNTPDSAHCDAGCDQRQDSTHIDEQNGKGTFEKLKKAGQTDKTQKTPVSPNNN
jgi:hypothetical protein